MNNDPHKQFFEHLRTGVRDRSILRLRLRPAGGGETEIRLLDLKTGPALSFVSQHDRKAITKNLPVGEGLKEIEAALATAAAAWLETTAKNWQLIATPGSRPRLVAHKAAAGAAAPDRSHDRVKHRHLDDATGWLVALELTDERGIPKTGRADKLRQIERYADLLAHFVADCGWTAGTKIELADMGCGKGYLTFAAWHLLRRKLGIDATITGIDAQPELVDSCNAVAKQIGADQISFRAGQIEDAGLPSIDALIALHACNDATDHALARGVAAGAKLIIVAPCCHKDVRRELGNPPPLAPLLGHGLFKERFAEWLTDGLRVLALEAAGYRVKVAEFIDAGHTPKNVLIGAVRGNTASRRAEAAAELAALKSWAGLGALPLDALNRTAG